MYKIQAINQPETAIWLNKLETLLSTEEHGDILLEKAFMQSEPTQVKIISEADKLYLADISFNMDIHINDNLIAKGARTQLKHNDQITIGTSKLEVFNPTKAIKRLTGTGNESSAWELEGVSNWLAGQRFKIKNRATLGRDKSCDITIPGSHLSRRHAEFFVANDKLIIKDLESANGCHINGERVQEAKLRGGEIIKLDELEFKVIAPDTDEFDGEMSHEMLSKMQSESPQVATPTSEKNWITKPTSVGNQVTESDLLLEKHKRNQRITYFSFALFLGVFIVGTIIWKL